MLWPFSLIVGHRMVRLSVDDLVAEAVEAHKNNECIEEPPEELPVPVRKFWLFIAHFPSKTSRDRTKNRSIIYALWQES